MGYVRFRAKATTEWNALPMCRSGQENERHKGLRHRHRLGLESARLLCPRSDLKPRPKRAHCESKHWLRKRWMATTPVVYDNSSSAQGALRSLLLPWSVVDTNVTQLISSIGALVAHLLFAAEWSANTSDPRSLPPESRLEEPPESRLEEGVHPKAEES
jgi:hypothetical protein